jgi:hypothetical protein
VAQDVGPELNPQYDLKKKKKSNTKESYRSGSSGKVAEHLPSKNEALSSNSSNTKKRKRKKKEPGAGGSPL